MKTFAVYKDLVAVPVNIDPHFAEAGDRRETVSALEKMRDPGGAIGE